MRNSSFLFPGWPYEIEGIQRSSFGRRNYDPEGIPYIYADLRRKIWMDQPVARVKYDFDIDLDSIIEGFLRGKINLKNKPQS
jgi:hypothetical protein